MNALTLYRLANWLYAKEFIQLSALISKINYLIFKCYVPGSATIGSNTRIAYGGIAVVIHSHATIGRGCVIGQCVTLGAKEAYSTNATNRSPVVGDNVYIAAGAKLLGGIDIGHSSIIGANAVVTKSYPPHSVIAGVPAKLIGTTPDDYRAIIINGQ